MTPPRQRMIENMQIRNLSRCTPDSYIQHVSRFARHFDKSQVELRPEDIRTYQVYLNNERKLARLDTDRSFGYLLSLQGYAQKGMGI